MKLVSTLEDILIILRYRGREKDRIALDITKSIEIKLAIKYITNVIYP